VTAEEYEYIVGTMGSQLEDGALEQDDFSQTVKEVIAIAILLAFLRASKKTEAQLTGRELEIIAENVQVGQDAADNMAADIAAGRYTVTDEKPNPPSILERAVLWGATILGIEAMGQLFRADDPFWRWQYGETEHCSDCVRLHGQVHRASEWLASGWSPKSPSLECHGYRCQCALIPADGPSSGSF
jgi:hypothetical protein